TLLNGTLPKLLPITPPASLSRQYAVASMKPTGMMLVLPTLSCSGAVSPFGWGSGGELFGLGEGAGPAAIGTVEATRPRFAGVVCWVAFAGGLSAGGLA